MNIAVVDGQGGGMGRSIAERVSAEVPEAELVVVGTNAAATANMLRGGKAQGATGENAVLYNCTRADVVVGPIGVFFANSMLGEVTPAMAQALAGCGAEKIAIPVSKCHINIVGMAETSLSSYIGEAVRIIKNLAKK